MIYVSLFFLILLLKMSLSIPLLTCVFLIWFYKSRFSNSSFVSLSFKNFPLFLFCWAFKIRSILHFQAFRTFFPSSNYFSKSMNRTFGFLLCPIKKTLISFNTNIAPCVPLFFLNLKWYLPTDLEFYTTQTMVCANLPNTA